MGKAYGPLTEEDYWEPNCPLSMERYGEAPVEPVPQQRIVQKLEDYMSRRDYPGAERHLLYWLDEALRGHDPRGELMIRNELIGHYRKNSQREEAFAQIEKALSLLDTMGFEDTRSAATTYINAATACSAFGENERAYVLFEKAKAIYEAHEATPKHLLGGLYNNMALACTALGRYEEALSLYDGAMEAMSTVPGGGLEQAITCLNRADVVAARDGLEAGEAEITALLEQAETLLHTSDAPHDGYYAFVCEKCAPTFDHYGFFLTAQELREEARSIYERP